MDKFLDQNVLDILLYLNACRVISMSLSSILHFSIAASVRIGNFLGANEPFRARMAAEVAIVGDFFIGWYFDCIFFLRSYNLFKIYSNC